MGHLLKMTKPLLCEGLTTDQREVVTMCQPAHADHTKICWKIWLKIGLKCLYINQVFEIEVQSSYRLA